jgi:hypothetical protein
MLRFITYIPAAFELSSVPQFVEAYVQVCTLKPWLAGHIVLQAGNFAEDVNSILFKTCSVNVVEWG